MYITVSNIQINVNPGSIYITSHVLSSGTDGGLETYVDDSASANDVHVALAESAREACRANGENVDNNALVMIFGSAIQVS